MPQDALSRLALLLGSRRGVASHAQPAPTPAETGPFIAPPPVRGRTPLPTNLPRSGGQRVFNEGVDALLGALGVKDALGAEQPSVGTAVGQLASMLSPMAVVGGLKRIAAPSKRVKNATSVFDKLFASAPNELHQNVADWTEGGYIDLDGNIRLENSDRFSSSGRRGAPVQSKQRYMDWLTSEAEPVWLGQSSLKDQEFFRAQAMNLRDMARKLDATKR